MARSYTKTKRAEQEAETRERIVDAALALHSEIGPLRTTISMIADRAGVQRHTVYAHFPDDRALFMGCSGAHLERAPPPDPATWDTINEPAARVRKALTALYVWFRENQKVTGAVLRDAESSAALREVSGLRFGAVFGAIYESLASGLSANGRAALTLALSFHTWQTLSHDAGLDTADAVDLMVKAVVEA